MDNLLFYTLLMLLVYYFLVYQKTHPAPLTSTTSTQTDLSLEAEINSTLTTNLEKLKQAQTQQERTIQELKTEKSKLEQDYQQGMKEKQEQITKLQTQIRDLVKRPLKPTSSQSTQTDSDELTNTLDNLIKGMQDLNNSL